MLQGDYASEQAIAEHQVIWRCFLLPAASMLNTAASKTAAARQGSDKAFMEILVS